MSGVGAEVWVPALVAAAGTAYSVNAQSEAESERQKAATAQLLRDQGYQQKQIQLATQNAEQYDPKNREVAGQKAVDTAADSLTQSLVKSREASINTPDAAGKVSKDFTTGKARTAASELQRSTDIARLMAKLRGPTDLRANESLINADYAGTGGSLAADRGFANSAANVQAGTIRPDGTATLLGNAASSIGTGLLANRLRKPSASGLSIRTGLEGTGESMG